MSKTFSKKPLAVALGTAFVLSGTAASASVFQITDLSSGGYMVAEHHEKSGEKSGEGKCGAEKKGANCDPKAGVDMKTGECACGAAKGKKAEGKCGEGKCGEGKCGNKK